MKRLLIALGLVAAFAAFDSRPADAYTVKVCSPSRSGAALGPARITAGTSGTIYSTDARGCALISSADLGDFSALGYAVESPYKSVVAKALTSAGTVVLPPSTFIQDIIVEEDSGAAPTGVRIGTVANGSDVLATSNVSASSIVIPEDDSKSTRAFSRTLPQTLYISAASFGSSRLNVTILYGYF
jgi:hypothetical protein